MNPNYSLRILTTISSHKAKRNVMLKFERYIDFVPREGMTMRFTNDDGEVMDIVFVGIHYDYAEKIWVEEHEDTCLTDEIHESEGPECTVTKEAMDAYIDYYKSFGWERIANV